MITEFLPSSHFLVEAIDPVTAAPVPDGTPGELVFSSLTREALLTWAERTAGRPLESRHERW